MTFVATSSSAIQPVLLPRELVANAIAGAVSTPQEAAAELARLEQTGVPWSSRPGFGAVAGALQLSNAAAMSTMSQPAKDAVRQLMTSHAGEGVDFSTVKRAATALDVTGELISQVRTHLQAASADAVLRPDASGRMGVRIRTVDIAAAVEARDAAVLARRARTRPTPPGTEHPSGRSGAADGIARPAAPATASTPPTAATPPPPAPAPAPVEPVAAAQSGTTPDLRARLGAGLGAARDLAGSARVTQGVDAVRGLAGHERVQHGLAAASQVATRYPKSTAAAAGGLVTLVGAAALHVARGNDVEGPGAASGPEPAPTIEPARIDIVTKAAEHFGMADIRKDGSLEPQIRDFKRTVKGISPDDPNTRWEAAFAVWTLQQAKAPHFPEGQLPGTVIGLKDWAVASGHFRPKDDAAARASGNLVFVARKDAFGLPWHDVGVIVGRTATHLTVVSGNKLLGGEDVVKWQGDDVLIGRVASVEVPIAATLEKDGMQIEGYLDPVSKPLPPPPKPKGPTIEQERQQLVQRALEAKGMKETDGANNGPEVFKYWKSTNGISLPDDERYWCAAFVSWLYNEQRRPIVDADGAISTQAITEWAQKPEVNLWHDNWDGLGSFVPQPGDPILFKTPRTNGGATKVNHIGIVKDIEVDASGKLIGVYTIEGNSPEPGSRDNNGVYEHHYRLDQRNKNGELVIRGFVDAFKAPKPAQ